MSLKSNKNSEVVVAGLALRITEKLTSLTKKPVHFVNFADFYRTLKKGWRGTRS